MRRFYCDACGDEMPSAAPQPIHNETVAVTERVDARIAISFFDTGSERYPDLCRACIAGLVRIVKEAK